ncbi:hypothetical protein J3R82DRAFT_2428 [Butyriboletus roseoflavus]|nr:hypothetical protein J3R82DRAFT_2428 [Butyriboletus roseoflavus]
MADGDNGESSVPSAGPKAIGSLARKPSDVTRQGTQKLKFVPTLPARRKKEYAIRATNHSSVCSHAVVLQRHKTGMQHPVRLRTRTNGGPRKPPSHLYTHQTREIAEGVVEGEVGEKEEEPRLDRLQLK